MSDLQSSPALGPIRDAKLALAAGNRTEAYRLAQLAVQLDPNLEDSWLVLAASSTPQEALAHLQQALLLHPGSPRALKGLQWARERLEQNRSDRPEQAPHFPGWQSEPETPPAAGNGQPALPPRFRSLPARELATRRVAPLPWLAAVLLLIAAAVFTLPQAGFAWTTRDLVATLPAGIYLKPSLTPTPTSTATATLTPTWTLTPTSTPTETPSPSPSATPSATQADTDTPTPYPTVVYIEEQYVYVDPEPAPSSAGGEPWIDVDLGAQMVTAYRGDEPVNTFTVSTGTSANPTVTGRYYIYVKYRYDDMAGPGYFLPDVPYVMYFYEGYSLHGTYWHSNFGTPMSHGCINLRTDDAAWLYDFAAVGTLVNIHY